MSSPPGSDVMAALAGDAPLKLLTGSSEKLGAYSHIVLRSHLRAGFS